MATAKIAQFTFDVEQPDPLPDFVVFLQKAKLEGLEYVLVPVDDDSNKNYLSSYIWSVLSVIEEGVARRAIGSLRDYTADPKNAEKRKIAYAVFVMMSQFIGASVLNRAAAPREAKEQPEKETPH